MSWHRYEGQKTICRNCSSLSTMGFWEIKLKSLSTELSHQAHFSFLIQSLLYPSLVLNLPWSQD